MEQLLTFGKQIFGNKGKPLKDLKKYKCGYCDYKFQQFIRTIVVNQNDESNGSKISTQVCCPCCGNFLKTYR